MIRYLLIFLLNLATPTRLMADLPKLGDPTHKELSPQQETIMGKKFFQSIKNNVPMIDDLIANDYLNSLGQSLVSHSDQAGRQFKFFLLKIPTINAFAGPDAYIGVNSGLVINAKDESELAGVLAHEISHVTQRHLARALSDSDSSPAAMIAAILAGILVSANDPTAGAAIIYGSTAAMAQHQINFTRSNEYEADRVGINLMRESGINPEGMADFFETLLRKAENNSELSQMEFLRTHPLSSTRVAEARNRLIPSDKKLPMDSMDFHLVKARLEVLSATSLDDLIARKRAMFKQKHDLYSEYALAFAFLQQNRPELAIQHLKHLISVKSHPWFQLDLANAYQMNQQYQQAGKLLQNLEKLYPYYLPVTSALARLQIQQHEYKTAIQLLRQALLHKKHPTLYRLLAQAYFGNGQVGAALENTSYQYELEGYNRLALQQVENALKQDDLPRSMRERLESRRKALMNDVQQEASLY